MIKVCNAVGRLICSVLFLFLLVWYKAYSTGEKPGIKITQNEEVIEFAQNIEASLENGNPSYFNGHFDMDSFINKIIMNEEGKLYDANNFNEGFVSGLRESFDFGSTIIGQVSHGGSYSFIKYYEKDSIPHIVFRLFNINGINYHDFELYQKDNDIMIVDMYIYLSGENMSTTFHRMYLGFLYSIGKSTIGRRMDDNYLESVIQYTVVKNTYNKGKFKKAYRKFRRIPDKFKKEKICQIMNIQISFHLSDKKYMKAIDEYMSLYPDDPSFYLVSVDGYILHERYDEAIQSIDSLDRQLGSDPFLDYLRGNLYYEMDDYEKAGRAYKNLIKFMPDFELGYLSLLGVLMEEYEYDDAITVMDMMTYNFNMYKEDFKMFLGNYPQFLESEEFTSWMNN